MPHTVTDPTAAAIAAVLDRLLNGDLDVARAAEELYRLSPTGLVGDVRALTPTQRTRLDELAPALRWEMAKKVAGSNLPKVPYGSPEYRTFMASIPRSQSDDTEPGGRPT